MFNRRYGRVVFCSTLALAGYVLFTPTIRAESPEAVNARAANAAVLKAHEQFLNTPAAQNASARSQVAAAIVSRASAMGAVIDKDPKAALQLAFSQDLLDRLAKDVPEAASSLEERGSWKGTAEVHVLDAINFKSSKTEVHLQAPAQRLKVSFADALPEGLKSGSILTVNGVRSGTSVAAAGGTVSGSTIPSGSCSTTGNQNVATLLVTFPGVTPPISASSVYNVMFGQSGRSLDGYWRDASYGKTSASGNVFGWYTLPQSYSCDQYSSLQAAAIQAADADVNFANYNRVFIIFPKPASCSWGGLGTIGCTTVSSNDGTVNASVSWIVADYMSPNDQGVELAAHEGGHNLGLSHSRTRDFGTDVLGPLEQAGTISEYGDSFSTMGYYNLGHYTAQQKNAIGWLPSTNVQTVQSSGTFSMAPLEVGTNSIQALKVQRGTGNNDWLWLEYRQPTGNYDSTLPSQIFSGATAHYTDSNTGSYTDLVDFTRSTAGFSDPALAAGSTWTDPYTNLSLGVQSATTGSVFVSVNYGSTPCTTGTPLVTVSPSNPSVAAGSSASYSATIKNNDSTGCSASTYTLSTSQPSGWSAGTSQSTITVNPGQTASVTMTQTPPSGTPAGTYPVGLAVAAASANASGSANLSVTAPPPPPPPSDPLSVTVGVGGGLTATTSYSTRSTVSINATVLSGSAGAANATVTFLMTKPNGQTATTKVTTKSNGTATWSYRLGPKDPTGTYSVSATATLGTQSASAGSPATFVVK